MTPSRDLRSMCSPGMQLNNFAKTCDSSGLMFCKTNPEILSGPVVFLESRPLLI